MTNEFFQSPIMNPAYSVILFTTASGAGYGLLAMLCLAGASHGRASTPAFAFISLLIALALITVGLLASTMHLGRPERAWRAFSQWRTSWLSREGIAAIITYPLALAFGACWSGLIDAPAVIAPLGYATAIMCWVTVFCTAKIYSTLKTIRAWHQPLTVPIYFVFSAVTGSVFLTAIANYFGRFAPAQAVLSLAALLTLIVLKFVYWRRLDRDPRIHTMAAATGLGEGVRQWEVPHTSTNFIMKEMGYVVARRHIRKLRIVTLALLNITFVLMLFSANWPFLAYLAVPVSMLAAWVERWLFFAEAEHVVGLFYGKDSA
jgi:sulfite dehydrogenase (quinone) subunit SoeC